MSLEVSSPTQKTAWVVKVWRLGTSRAVTLSLQKGAYTMTGNTPQRIIVIFDSDRAGELLDLLTQAGARLDLVGFAQPWQVAAIDRIMKKDSTYSS